MRTFKTCTPEQIYLLPPNIADWLPEGHLAQFVSEVVDHLDLELIFAEYENGDERGQPPYHPAMMVKLLLYGYCTGKPSSHKIEKSTWEDVGTGCCQGISILITTVLRSFGSDIYRYCRGSFFKC